MHRHDEHARSERQATGSRATVGRPPGLDWVQTFVLKATCDVAMDLWERRLTLDQVAERLRATTQVSRAQIEASVGPICDRGYLIADDAPGNPEVVVHVTDKGLEAYCHHFIGAYDGVRREIFTLVCQDQGCDVHEIARRTGQSALLVEHILDVAQSMALLRLSKTGQYIVVREVTPRLRRLISGAA